jgi:outer membrane receptor for ferrienterochelin and colicins
MKPFQTLKHIALCMFCLCCLNAVAQTARVSGKIVGDDGAVAYANVFLKGTQIGTTTDFEGRYTIENIPEGTYTIEVSAIGFIPISESVSVKDEQSLSRDFTLKKDVLNISQVVITGSRNRVKRYNSPVIVNTINEKTFEAVQAFTVGEGLNFSPGLRVENNCQNCGFTQLRMNGLDGPYSQVLINSRPVFSALAGVYGLEMLPANMVERIEVVRGGGSVMYGGNAIAGTVNIITKNPVENTFEVGINQSLINGEASDRTVNVNGSVVSDDLNQGITFFGFNRNRDHWDANSDGFSEITELQNNTFGFDAFHNFNDRNKLELGAYYINEYRRGGNKFDLFPHQTDITEELKHVILSTNLNFEHYSKDDKHKISLYGSLQHVDRSSYYGGGGRVISPGDSLTTDDVLAINAYGNSKDISTVSGVQYNFYVNPVLTITAGSEYLFNDVSDEMPGYDRAIDQRVGTWGTFAELEMKPLDKLTFLIGGRFDQLDISGRYDLEEERFVNDETINVFVPRLTAMYGIRENLKLRASFAQGYRGPQAFDEDLHIETVGGAARFIRINPDLEVERSNSAVLSLNYDKYVGNNQMNFVVEGFYTRLIDPFIFANQEELPSGVAVITKRNGEGATVSGVNVEANIAFGSKLVFQSGATFQTARYEMEEEIWAPEEPTEDIEATTTDRLLRTPQVYGYFSLVYNPLEALSLAYSGVVTGSMEVPHVIDADTERTIIDNTPTFFENNLKLSYSFRAEKNYQLEVFGGVQNIFDGYQEDFDRGADRDAGYVYGPLRPRTFFVGLKFGLD